MSFMAGLATAIAQKRGKGGGSVAATQQFRQPLRAILSTHCVIMWNMYSP